MGINGINELRKNLKFVQLAKVENGKKKRKMNRGYVKLWRKSIDSGFFQNPNLWTFWCWCLMKASHKKINQVVGFQNIELLPGQFLFGRKAASVELKMSERTIRTSLDALRKRQNIAIKTTNKFSIITVINWDTYQCDRPTSDQQSDQQATSKRPASDHKQECKTFKNENNINIIGENPQAPKTENEKPKRFVKPCIEEISAYCIERNNGIDAHNFFDHYEANGWMRGKSKVKDWRACVRTWERNGQNKKNGGAKKNGFNEPGYYGESTPENDYF